MSQHKIQGTKWKSRESLPHFNWAQEPGVTQLAQKVKQFHLQGTDAAPFVFQTLFQGAQLLCPRWSQPFQAAPRSWTIQAAHTELTAPFPLSSAHKSLAVPVFSEHRFYKLNKLYGTVIPRQPRPGNSKPRPQPGTAGSSSHWESLVFPLQSKLLFLGCSSCITAFTELLI